ncbi:MAG: Type 1 glutamine amidotransferase-like domain-containing protein, partial [Rhodococcus sp. (in: high G+C Gram-positive bacteria)]
MDMDSRVIVATSGGYKASPPHAIRFDSLVRHAVNLSGCEGTPRVCTITTAYGDDSIIRGRLDEAGRIADFAHSNLALFPRPNIEHIEEHLMAQHVIWVHGGSVAGMLTVWRLHGLDGILRRAWESGVVLAGTSAGSLCWHVGGPTDSYGSKIDEFVDGLRLLPYGNSVHFDSEPERRAVLTDMILGGRIPVSYCAEDGVGLVYR